MNNTTSYVVMCTAGNGSENRRIVAVRHSLDAAVQVCATHIAALAKEPGIYNDVGYYVKEVIA